MEIEYDDRKRALTLEHRGLDFADAALVFEGAPSRSRTIARTTASSDTRRWDRLAAGSSWSSGHRDATLAA